MNFTETISLMIAFGL